MNVLVFEDEQTWQLSPITIARPAFSITCAALRLVDFLEQLSARAGFTVVSSVRQHLGEIVRLNHDCFAQKLDEAQPITVVVNARCVPCAANFNAIETLLASPDSAAVVFDELGNVACGVIATSKLSGCEDDAVVAVITKEFESQNREADGVTVPTFCLPHDVIRFNQEHFNDNLGLLIAQKKLKQHQQDGLYVAADATMANSVAVDTTDGPVVVDSGAKIKPFAYLQGPVYIGPNCTVNEHAAIKDYVCLTNTIKAGGEIEASVIEPYSNKQHHGFLGHSYLGSWINLGAGTCNSDLKNTYGKVSAVYGEEKVATGMQFVGCFIGDYSKTAINASIYTGKSIGVCSMLYGIVPANVPSFVNYARVFDQITEVPVEVMVTTQARMFARRKIEPRQCDVQLMHDMFKLTQQERKNSNIKASQLSF